MCTRKGANLAPSPVGSTIPGETRGIPQPDRNNCHAQSNPPPGYATRLSPTKRTMPYTKFQEMVRAYRRCFPVRGQGRWGGYRGAGIGDHCGRVANIGGRQGRLGGLCSARRTRGSVEPGRRCH